MHHMLEGRNPVAACQRSVHQIIILSLLLLLLFFNTVHMDLIVLHHWERQVRLIASLT